MSLYKQANSQIWWVSLVHPNHPRVRRSTGTADKAQAQRIHDEIKAQLWNAPVIHGKTWGQAVLLWASVPGRGEPDVLAMSKFGRVYKDRALTLVSKESLLSALSFCRTPSTYMRYRNRIMAILNMAKEHGWVREVPKLPTKRVETKARDWITREQWEALAKELPAHQRAMAEFAIETGLRQSNVLQLTWSQVSLERRVVWYEAEDMKGRRSISVPLSDRAMAVLSAQKGLSEVWVFTYREKPIQEVKTAFQAACIRAGLGRIDGKGVYSGFTWHGLRHTWATWHIQNGTPLEVLQKLGGWADLRMVMRYAHHTPGFIAQYANNASLSSSKGL